MATLVCILYLPALQYRHLNLNSKILTLILCITLLTFIVIPKLQKLASLREVQNTYTLWPYCNTATLQPTSTLALLYCGFMPVFYTVSLNKLFVIVLSVSSRWDDTFNEAREEERSRT